MVAEATDPDSSAATWHANEGNLWYNAARYLGWLEKKTITEKPKVQYRFLGLDFLARFILLHRVILNIFIFMLMAFIQKIPINDIILSSSNCLKKCKDDMNQWSVMEDNPI